MPLIPFVDKAPTAHLRNRVAIREGRIRLGAQVKRSFPTRWVLVTYDALARRLVLISARERDEGTYYVDSRGRIACLRALKRFGLERVSGAYRVERIERGRVSVVLPKRAVRRAQDDRTAS